MATQWIEALVSEIIDISETKRIIKIKTENAIDFKAGQFVTFDLPIGEKRRQRWRSYSIASSPNNSTELEFAIGAVPFGAASKYFFETITLDSKLKFKLPDGLFVLPEDLDRPITFICTGTGLVPFISMLRSIEANKLDFHSIHLVYGSRYERDLLYLDFLKTFSEKNKNFKFSIALSREEKWEGTKGYVHSIYQNHKEAYAENHLFLLCGWSNMIDQAVAYLFPKLKNPAKQLKYELYG